MSGPIPFDPASLSLDELVRLREMLRVRPGQRSLETRVAIEQRHKLIGELAHTCYLGSKNS